MRLPYLLICLLLAVPGESFAEQRLLGAPVFDDDAETTYRKIAWSDFKSQPRGGGRGSQAHIGVSVNAARFETEVRKEEGEWIARPVGVRPYCVMGKYQSAASSGARKDWVLVHMQQQFDLCEAFARRMALELATVRGGGEFAQEANVAVHRRLEAEFERQVAELEKLRERFSRETRGGANKEKAGEWSERIAAMMEEATAGLAAAMGVSLDDAEDAGGEPPDPEDQDHREDDPA